MKRLAIVVLAVLLLAGSAFAQNLGMYHYKIGVTDEFGRTVSGLTSVTIKTTADAALTIYADDAKTAKTNAITTGLAGGNLEFWTVLPAVNILLQDANTARTSRSVKPTTGTIMFPTFLTTMSSTTYGASDTATFGASSDWVQKCSTANRLDHIPANTNAVFAIGSQTKYADLQLFGTESGKNLTWDASAGKLIVAGTGGAGAVISVGSATPLVISNVSGNPYITATTPLSLDANVSISGNVQIGLGDLGTDFTLNGAASGDTVVFDSSANTLSLTNVALSTYMRTIVTNTGTANVVLAAADSGKVYASNRTTGAEQTYTLPTAAAGLTFTFIDMRTTAGDDLKVIANTGDKINNGTAAAYIVDSGDDTYGVSVTLTAIDATQWIITSVAPAATSWTAGGP
jgi:hypothetical protein